MVHDHETLLDPQRFAELDELLAGELSSVVCDYLLGNFESADDITPDKLLYFCRGYLCKLLRFRLFSEIINRYYNMLASIVSCRSGLIRSMPHMTKGHGLLICCR